MKIVIYGTGQIGSVVNNILKDAGHEIVGYVDDNISLHSKKINGVQVFGGGKWLLKKKKNMIGSVWESELLIQEKKSLIG